MAVSSKVLAVANWASQFSVPIDAELEPETLAAIRSAVADNVRNMSAPLRTATYRLLCRARDQLRLSDPRHGVNIWLAEYDRFMGLADPGSRS